MLFTSCVFPSALKLLKLFLFIKKILNYTFPTNDQSHLCQILKILEKLIYSTRIFKFCKNNNFFYPLQFGFRQNYSTMHALINFAETIRKYLHKRKFACNIFLDLQKAFDTVEQDILLQKLEHDGVRGLANDWFKFYLSNRKQFLSLNG